MGGATQAPRLRNFTSWAKNAKPCIGGLRHATFAIAWKQYHFFDFLVSHKHGFLTESLPRRMLRAGVCNTPMNRLISRAMQSELYGIRVLSIYHCSW